MYFKRIEQSVVSESKIFSSLEKEKKRAGGGNWDFLCGWEWVWKPTSSQQLIRTETFYVHFNLSTSQTPTPITYYNLNLDMHNALAALII